MYYHGSRNSYIEDHAVHSLAKLQSGELKGIQHLKVEAELTSFPAEIFDLADSLEILDLSNNKLSELPKNLAELYQLKTLFLNNNLFTEVPEVLSTCPHLDLISLKSNQVAQFKEHAVPKKTRWLILTDNKLTQLPSSIGDLQCLQKFMLAGNQLKSLPDSMRHCHNLQLLRIAANQLSELPSWIGELSKLSWLAFAGNPFSQSSNRKAPNLPKATQTEFNIQEQLGEGASGVIHKAIWKQLELEVEVAIKLFKGGITSDGYPEDELHASLNVGLHPNLIEVTGHISDKNQSGLVMNLIPGHFTNLGLPPSLESCTRDHFENDYQLNETEVLKIAVAMADTLEHLHDKQISHGDLYAHNILIDHQANILFGDFGAASDFSVLPKKQQSIIKTVEIRAFGYLLEDLLSLIHSKEETILIKKLTVLKNIYIQCNQESSIHFFDIRNQLTSINLNTNVI